MTMLSITAAAGRGGGSGGKRPSPAKKKGAPDPTGAGRNRRARPGTTTSHTASRADLLLDAAARVATSAKAAAAVAAARERAADEAAALTAIAAVAAGRASVLGTSGARPATAKPQPGASLLTPELTAEALLKHAGGPLPLPTALPPLASDGPPGKRTTRARGARKGAERAALAAHQAALGRALDAELETERAETAARLKEWPRARLAAAGAALFGLTVRRAGALYGDPLLRLSRPGGVAPLPFHAFTPGDAVLMTPGGGRDGQAAFPDLDGGSGGTEGVLLDYSTTWLRVAVSPAAAARILGSGGGGGAGGGGGGVTSPIASGGWRLDLHVSQTPHDRCVAALADLCAPPPATRSPEDGAAAGLRRALVAGVGGVASPTAAEATAALPPPWAAGPAAKAARAAAAAALRSPSSGLNASQAGAAVAALGRTLTLWQGPPGTGKTRTLAAFLTAVVRHSVLKPPSRHAAAPPPGPPPPRGGGGGDGDPPSPSSAPPRPVPILVTAASNVAVDNMVLALLEASSCGGAGAAPPLRIVRLGPPAKAAPAVRHLSLAAMVADSPTGKAAAAARAKAASTGGPAARAERERGLQLAEAAAARILSRAHIIAATCIGAGDPALDGLSFGLVALDEASQATEPAALVPLLRKARAAVLVGDPAQLPPTVVSAEAVRAGLGVSLFERLAGAGVGTHLLDTQYRMHPAIASFPAGHFYGGRLVDGVAPRDRPAPRPFPWPDARSPVAFVPVEAGRETRAGGTGFYTAGEPDGGGSYANAAEVAAVLAAARLLVCGGGEGGNGAGRHRQRPLEPAMVGIITPYAGQARALRCALDAAGSASLAAIEVRTVDGFQGREKEVILFSAVRANEAGRVGFLADGRRLNVALTRARCGLVVFGARRTLAADATWRAWLGWVDGRGLVVGRGAEAAAGLWAAVDGAVGG